MVTSTSLDALKKTKDAIHEIKKSLQPVVNRLKNDAFEKATAQAQATVSLSIGMMKYMGARLQGLDRGRKPDDPLRKELNQMRKVLAEIKSRYSEQVKMNEKHVSSHNDFAKKRSTTAEVSKDTPKKTTQISRKLLTKKSPSTTVTGPVSVRKTKDTSGKRAASEAKQPKQKRRKSS